MAKTERYTCAQIIAALKETKGVYLAARKLKCSHVTVYNYIHKHPSVKAAWDAIDGETTDFAAFKLREAVLKGDPWAIQFQLRMKGKERGYVDTREVDGDLEIVLKWDEAPTDDSTADTAPGAE